MKEIDVAIVGDIAWNQDITPFGNKISPGGAAYYSSVGASVYSEKVGVVAKTGNDFDTALLKDKKIDVEGVKRIDSGKTCRFIIRQSEDNTREFEADRGVSETVDTGIFPESYRNAKFFHLPTQLPSHALTWLDFLNGRKNISVDTFEQFVKDFPELTRVMIAKASLVFTNEAEINILRGLGEISFKVPVIVKKGKSGAAYIFKDQSVFIDAPKVAALDTTGAGDVLAGAFLAQKAKGISTATSLEMAVKTASLSVTRFGVDHIFPGTGLAIE